MSTSPEAPAPDGDAPAETSSSLVTVLVALAANALVAVAKSAAAALTGSASMVAEAAHSWADTGNEVALLVAEKRGARPRDAVHPRGYGRSTYLWSLVAAFGLFVAGAVLSIWHGVTEIVAIAGGEARDEPGYFTVGYVVLAVAFVLEGASFLQALNQVRDRSARFHLRPLQLVSRTSDPTLRAVFLEDSSALVGLVLAATGIGLHQATGNPVWDALGSVAVGVLLAFVALFLIRRNMEYLVGKQVPEPVRTAVLRVLLAHPQVARVTYLHIEYVGPMRLFVVAAVDLVGDEAEPLLAVRLRRLEAELERRTEIEDAVLTLATPDEVALGL